MNDALFVEILQRAENLLPNVDDRREAQSLVFLVRVVVFLEELVFLREFENFGEIGAQSLW